MDFAASLSTSFREGAAEKQMEIAKNFISIGLDNAIIAKGTGLFTEQIEALREEMK